MIPKADIRELEELIDEKAEGFAEQYEMDFDVCKNLIKNTLIDLLVSDFCFPGQSVNEVLKGAMKDYLYRTNRKKYEEVK